MSGIFSMMDDSAWNSPPTPDPSPTKHNRLPSTPKRKVSSAIRTPVASKNAGPSPSKVFSASDADIASMLEGVEDIWDWDTTVLSPKKESKTADVRPLKGLWMELTLPDTV